MRNLCKEFKALPEASTRAFTSSLDLVVFHYRLKKQLKIVQAMKAKYLLQVTMKAFLNVKKKLLLTTLMQNPSLILHLQVKILLILLIMKTLGDLQT